ncbi:hypothetical protein [Pseudomonas sp. NPDC089758]|uniref:hypothetical protein n=1 Tax=Pseudomonas sp. NPDC089758 TaxID=3364473 RepID=UPI00380F19B9
MGRLRISRSSGVAISVAIVGDTKQCRFWATCLERVTKVLMSDTQRRWPAGLGFFNNPIGEPELLKKGVVFGFFWMAVQFQARPLR